jgi:uncharacterized membrane protein (DUF106 family)
MSFLDPVLGWALKVPPLLGIFLLSLIITLTINLIYKFTTDQKEMKRLKDQIEDYRKKIKEARDNPKKMMKLNNEAMSVNMQYMGKSLKPTLFTFLPIIFIFAWMNANFTYAPLDAGEPLIVNAQFLEGFSGKATLTSETLTSKNVQAELKDGEDGPFASFAVSGAQGPHNFTINYNEFSYNGTVWFGEKPTQQVFVGKGPVQQITVDYPRIRPLGSVSLFGWRPGWLAVYIFLSIALSISTRKLMKIY